MNQKNTAAVMYLVAVIIAVLALAYVGLVSGDVPETIASLLVITVLVVGAAMVWHSAHRIRIGAFQLDQALEEVKSLTSVIDTSFDGIVLTDTRGMIRHVNPNWERITGWTASEVEGKATPQVLKSGYHDADFYSNFWLTIQNGDMFRGKLINKRKDGGYYLVDEVVLPVKDKQGRVTGFAAFHHVLDPDYKPAEPPPVKHEYTEAS